MYETLSLAGIVVAVLVALVGIADRRSIRRRDAERDTHVRAIRDQLNELCRVAYRTSDATARFESILASQSSEHAANTRLLLEANADLLRQSSFDARLAGVDIALGELGKQLQASLETHVRVQPKPAKPSKRTS